MSEQNTGASVPLKVNIAFEFVRMMRTSACRHLSHDTDSSETTTVCKNRADTEAYAAASQVLRTWFNGENDFTVQSKPDAGGGNDTPPGHGAKPNPPSPGTAPTQQHVQEPVQAS